MSDTPHIPKFTQSRLRWRSGLWQTESLVKQILDLHTVQAVVGWKANYPYMLSVRKTFAIPHV